MPELSELGKLLVAAVSLIACAWVALRDGLGARDAPAPSGRRRRAVAAGPPAPSEPVAAPPAAGTRQGREWLLDAIPAEDQVPRGARVAGAGRLAIGIAAMGIAAALAVLGFSRALSAIFDRVLR